MTKQEVFNNVWNHFVIGGNPQCVVEQEAGRPTLCSYRGCAVGINLPEDFRNRLVQIEKEDRYITAHGLFNFDLQTMLQTFGPKDDWKQFLTDLQMAHDSWKHETTPMGFADYMRVKLNRIAGNYNLSVPS